jgi:hypothetical protein
LSELVAGGNDIISMSSSSLRGLRRVVAENPGSMLPPISIAGVASGHMPTRLGASAEMICATWWRSIYDRIDWFWERCLGLGSVRVYIEQRIQRWARYRGGFSDIDLVPYTRDRIVTTENAYLLIHLPFPSTLECVTVQVTIYTLTPSSLELGRRRCR